MDQSLIKKLFNLKGHYRSKVNIRIINKVDAYTNRDKKLSKSIKILTVIDSIRVLYKAGRDIKPVRIDSGGVDLKQLMRAKKWFKMNLKLFLS